MKGNDFMWEMVKDGKVKCLLDLSDVPRGKYRGKERYRWINSTGYKIGIRYKWHNDDVEERWFEIVDYDKKTQKLMLKWNENEYPPITTHSLLEGNFGTIFGKKTSKFRYEIGQTVNTLTLIEKYYKKDEKGRQRKYYKYRCEKGHIHDIEESNLKCSKGCPECSNSVPLTEKFMLNLLFFKNIEYITQATKNNFDWIKDNRRYDFALPTYKTIIEIDGDPRSHGDRTNDNFKDEMALNNGWNMIRINLLENYNGSFEQLWSAYKPILNNLGIHIMDEEAKECYIKSQNSIFNLVVDIANNNTEFSCEEIANKLKKEYGYQLHFTTICEYLRTSNELGLTNYENKIIKIKVICITTGEIYESVHEAERKIGTPHANIIKCCTGKRKSAGVIDGKPAIWMYLDEYEKLSKEEIEKIKNQEVPNGSRPKAVICITTEKIYESCSDAGRKTGIHITSICDCCRGERKSAGKLNGEKLVWMYYEDYLESLK